MLKRSLLVLVSMVGIGSAANAVSVAIAPDQASYLPGELVTLTVTVDASGATDVAVFGQFFYDPAILLGGDSTQQVLTAFSGNNPWIEGTLPCPDAPGTCVAFNQVSSVLASYFVDQPPGFAIATITFTAGAVGARTSSGTARRCTSSARPAPPTPPSW